MWQGWFSVGSPLLFTCVCMSGCVCLCVFAYVDNSKPCFLYVSEYCTSWNLLCWLEFRTMDSAFTSKQCSPSGDCTFTVDTTVVLPNFFFPESANKSCSNGSVGLDVVLCVILNPQIGTDSTVLHILCSQVSEDKSKLSDVVYCFFVFFFISLIICFWIILHFRNLLWSITTRLQP